MVQDPNFYSLPCPIPRFLSNALFALVIVRSPLLNLNSRTKGTFIIRGPLRNLDSESLIF